MNSRKPQFLFGVTGGIGCGKSAVCGFLREKGVAIIEADAVARHLTNTLPAIREALTSEFGPDVYLTDGSLNKQRLSELVFESSECRNRINGIIHPHVRKWTRDEATRLFEEDALRLVAVEAALVYESGMQEILNAVIVVDAPLENRIAWVAARNGLSRAEILARMAAQMPVEEKLRLADYVVENDGTIADLHRRVEDLYKWLSRKILQPG